MGLITGLCLGSTAFGQIDTVENRLTSENFSAEQLDHIFQLAKRYPVGGEIAVGYLEGDSTFFLGARIIPGAVESTENRSSAFAIGSVTKVMTATLLASALMDGRLELTDTVNEAYDFPFADSIAFTYAQLASHSSGLPRLPGNMPGALLSPDDPYGSYTPEMLEAYLREDMGLVPEELRGYSNLGFGLLAYTLSHKIWDTTYSALLDEWIFDPLEMIHSSNGPDSSLATPVPGLNADGTPAPYWHFTDAMAGAGAVVSTAEDLSRFLRAQFDEEDMVLGFTRRPVVTTNERQAVGLGWQIIRPEADRTIYWHNGAVAGYRSFVGVDVEEMRGVVVLTNALLMGPDVDKAGMDLLR